MFATVFKNSILFILIILIIHFLINNILIDKKISIKELDYENDKKTNTMSEFDIKKNIDINNPKPERTNSNTEMKELYDYVFDKNAKKGLNDYYEIDNNIDANNNKDSEIKCADDCNNNYCNTTKPTHDELKAHYGNFNKLSCSDNLEQDKHSYIVNNYRDEKPMNGGKSKDCEIVAYDLTENLYEHF